MIKTSTLILFLFISIFSADYSVNVDISAQYQTIEGFGASDAWNSDFVGKYWGSSEKEGIAELLFSKEINSAGSAKGIGLSRWRFNVGAGSHTQGESSNIGDETRRTDCFLQADGSYDWSQQAGQVWFLEKAEEYKVEHLIAFSNSPPIYYTKNGLANQGQEVTSANIASEKYPEFSTFLAEVLQHFKSRGINFSEVSPLNEPQWQWTDGQEGSLWTNENIFGIVKSLDSTLRKYNLETEILVTEAGSFDYLHQWVPGSSNSDQMWNFFDASRPLYIADLPHVPRKIGGHSYWTCKNDAILKSTRENIASEAEMFNLEVQQSEYSMLEFPEGVFDNHWDIALFVAKLIYADLTIASVTAWDFWTALDRERWGHKNRFSLVRLIPHSGDYGPLTEGGTYSAQKTLWTLGQYSLFIRPEYLRVKTTGAEELSGLMASTFISPDTSKIVTVYVNMSKSSHNIQQSITSLPGEWKADSYKRFITSDSHDIKLFENSDSFNGNFTIPASSVNTVVIDIKKDPSYKKNVYNEIKRSKELKLLKDRLILKGFENLNIKIFSSRGQLVFRGIIKSGIVKFKRSLPKGVYFIEAISSDKTTKNFLKRNL